MLVLPEASTRVHWCGCVWIVWFMHPRYTLYPPPLHTHSLQGLSGIEVNVRTPGPVVAER